MSFAAASQDAVDHELRDGFDKDCTVERAERLDKVRVHPLMLAQGR